jgi:hypothetical protein
MSITEKEIVSILRLCLQSSLIPVDIIEQWSLKKIDSSEIIRDDYILELCSAKRLGLNETLHILKENESDLKNILIWEIVYGIVGLLYQNNSISLRTACKAIDQIIIDSYNDTEFKLSGSGLDDSFYLANSKTYGTIEDVEQELMALTTPHLQAAKVFMNEVLYL